MKPFFTIIIVCLNPGEKLAGTLKSVEKQTFHNYEVIIKDGLSKDGSLSYAYDLQRVWEKEQGCVFGEANAGGMEEGTGKENGKDIRSIAVISKKDAGIYDAMNQAAAEARGNYLYFLNCRNDIAYLRALSKPSLCFVPKFFRMTIISNAILSLAFCDVITLHSKAIMVFLKSSNNRKAI